MKILSITLLLISSILLTAKSKECSRIGTSTPSRLVSISGKAMIINLPGAEGAVPATSETIIFQREGCESCFCGARVDQDGFYRVLVGDGKYKVIVRNPSSPEKDWLAPDQERFIDTGNINSPVQHLVLISESRFLIKRENTCMWSDF